MDGPDARGRSAANHEGGQHCRNRENFFHIVEHGLALGNLRLGFSFGTARIVDPRVSGEPLVRLAAQRTVCSAEEHGRGTKSRQGRVSARGNCPVGLRATNHKHAHEERFSWLGAPRLLPVCEEKLKTRWQFLDLVKARGGALVHRIVFSRPAYPEAFE